MSGVVAIVIGILFTAAP